MENLLLFAVSLTYHYEYIRSIPHLLPQSHHEEDEYIAHDPDSDNDSENDGYHDRNHPLYVLVLAHVFVEAQKIIEGDVGLIFVGVGDIDAAVVEDLLVFNIADVVEQVLQLLRGEVAHLRQADGF